MIHKLLVHGIDSHLPDCRATTRNVTNSIWMKFWCVFYTLFIIQVIYVANSYHCEHLLRSPKKS